MASRKETPNFAELLAPFLDGVPAAALPGLLAGLEREAARRYRDWAAQVDGPARETLLACATREDEIAARVERALPIPPPDRAAVDAALAGAIPEYRNVFDDMSLADQVALQADAELQGAAAWRGLVAGTEATEVVRVLASCAELEEASSAAAKDLLAEGALG